MLFEVFFNENLVKLNQFETISEVSRKPISNLYHSILLMNH